LAVVTILVDLPAFRVLFVIDLLLLAARDMAVVHGRVVAFLIADALVLGMKLRRFAGVQLIVSQASVDAMILASETAVYLCAPRMVVLPLVGVSDSSKHETAEGQSGENRGDSLGTFHNSLLEL
jgi:hypothetical protein